MSGAKRFDRIREGLKVCLTIALVSYVILGSVMTLFPRMLALVLLNGEAQISYAVQFLPVCGIMLFAVDMLFVFRSGVQGMGFPLIPMISGILEMVLRIGTISLFIGSIGFRATAFAEVCAWLGAMSLNAVAFVFIYFRESGKSLFKSQLHLFRRRYQEEKGGC